MTQAPFTMCKHDVFFEDGGNTNNDDSAIFKYDTSTILKMMENCETGDRMITKMTQEPFTMWKHKSTGENQLGDYDYYLYDDPR